jgi:NAD(P)-dependent dehydrogenase (short-subunit alcohol dehydrogenase family)
MRRMAAPPVNQLFDLAGRVALVTGASGNIGAGIARRLHEAGASVLLHCGARRAPAEALASELGSRAAVAQGDVEREADRLCVEAATVFGHLDVVVNNAGIQPVKPLLEITAEETAEMLRVNVGGVAAMTRAAAAHLPRGGSIVNISSIEGLQPATFHSHYTASKAAVLMHTRAAALELGGAGIRVNAVAPGLIHAEGIEQGWPEGVARWQVACPLDRLGEPDDIGDAVLFLASPAARWITGAILVVDGGVLANNTW